MNRAARFPGALLVALALGAAAPGVARAAEAPASGSGDRASSRPAPPPARPASPPRKAAPAAPRYVPPADGLDPPLIGPAPLVGPPVLEGPLTLEAERGLTPPPRERAPLPPVTPAPAIAPVIAPPPPPAEQVAPEDRTGVVIRTILGLSLLLGLTYAAAHPAIERWERRMRISQVVTAGLPFILLGMAARHPAIGVLGDDVLAQLAPVLRLGLGWIGFLVGFRLDARQLAGTEERSVATAAILASLPFVLVVAAAALVLAPTAGPLAQSLRDPVFLRDALVLGTAASMTAATAPILLPRSAPPAAGVELGRIVRIEEIAGIVGLALVTAYFRPQGDAVTWRLPGTAWLMLTAGAGTLLGLLFLGLLRRAKEGPEFAVLALGAVAFSAGLAGYLHLSSVVVCFVAGVLLANFPGSHQARFRAALDALERPVYLALLVILGAIWPTGSLTGWLLIPIFVVARIAGRWLGVRAAERVGMIDPALSHSRVLAVAPVGSLAIGIVVNAQLLYPGGSISDVVVAVVGGALATEPLVQAARRRDDPAHAEQLT